MGTEDYLHLRLDEVLDRLAAGGRAPGGGSAAALTVAFAASLVAMVARCSHDRWEDAAGVSAQALAIADRAARLAGADAAAWEAATDALERAAGGESGSRELERKLRQAAALPLEIAELGADAAELAALAGQHCDGADRADAATAAALAAGASGAAAHLVAVNLAVREGDERLRRARTSERTASEAAQRTLASVG